jgi:murein endopeptidase
LISDLHKFACGKEGESALVKKFFKNCDLSYTVGSKKRWGLIDHLGGHADHYHIRIRCPKGDDQCKGTKTSREVSLPVIS